MFSMTACIVLAHYVAHDAVHYVAHDVVHYVVHDVVHDVNNYVNIWCF
jgi:hypothetical protein